MSSVALRASTIIGEDRDHHDSWLIISDGVIIDVVDQAPADTRQIDLGDVRLAPGLIDIHIHGREGRDVMDADLAALDTMSRSLATHGVTGFLATTVTSSWDRTLDALRVVGQACATDMPGARVLGAYSEGLFFSCLHKGAHNEAFFLLPTMERVDAMIEAAAGCLKVIALAPEIEGAMPVIGHAVSRDVRVVLGHTDATYDLTCEALALGASGGVHLFNGMRGIHHREPGCAGALLLERCTVEVIADGVHLHPAILKLIARLKPADDILLISDCMCAGGLSDGEYRLGESSVTVADGVARAENGSLAGSTLTLDQAVMRLARTEGVPFRDAVHMASLYPARFAGVADRLGSIAVGKRADLVAFDCEGRVMATFVDGLPVHCESGWTPGDAVAAVAADLRQETKMLGA